MCPGGRQVTQTAKRPQNPKFLHLFLEAFWGHFRSRAASKSGLFFFKFFGEAFCEALGDLGSQSAPKRRSPGGISASFWQVVGTTKTTLPPARERHLEAGGGSRWRSCEAFVGRYFSLSVQGGLLEEKCGFRVPRGSHGGPNWARFRHFLCTFSGVRFLSDFRFDFGRGRRQGRGPRKPETGRVRLNSTRPATPEGCGEYLKASPLPPAPTT